MQNMEEYQDESGGVQLSTQTPSFKFGLWVNISKNPRLKTVDFPQLGISLEVCCLDILSLFVVLAMSPE